MHLLFFLTIGGYSGWFAGNLLKDVRFGHITNTIVGIFGGFLGRWYVEKLGLDADYFLTILNPFITILGVLQLLFLFSIVKRVK